MKKAKIDLLLKNRPDLKCERAYKQKESKIKEILELPYWQDEKYQKLLTTNIWKTTKKDIEKILNMSCWNERKFKKLLTSNIWNSNSTEVEEILSMEEWNDVKYQKLLTSNIWHSKPDEIKKILKLPILKQEKYKHLLVPSIFNVSFKNIEPSIQLFEEYGIGSYITNRSIRRNVETQRILLNYLKENKKRLLLITETSGYKLNPIISASTTKLREKYGINIKKLIEQEKEKEGIKTNGSHIRKIRK